MNSSQPLVSVLINNYNYGRYLRQSIDSVLSQSYSKLELIVVDDGSGDESVDILNSYSTTPIKTIFKPNGGQASAFNTGFSAATGDLILFLDSDDYFYPEKVKEIVFLFKDRVDIGWIFHQLEYVDIQGNAILSVSEPSLKISQSQSVDVRRVLAKGRRLNHIIPCGLCFRRECLDAILPMPESVGVTISDNYIKYAALSLAPGVVLAQKLAAQRIHDSNSYTFRSNSQKLQAEINIKTGYYLKKRFAHINHFADKLFSRGCGEMIIDGNFMYLQQMKEVRTYFSRNSLFTAAKILLRTLAYVLFSLPRKNKTLEDLFIKKSSLL